MLENSLPEKQVAAEQFLFKSFCQAFVTEKATVKKQSDSVKVEICICAAFLLRFLKNYTDDSSTELWRSAEVADTVTAVAKSVAGSRMSFQT